MKPRGIGAWREEANSSNATTQTLLNSNKRNKKMVGLLKRMSEVDEAKIINQTKGFIDQDNVIIYSPPTDRDSRDSSDYLIVGSKKRDVIIFDLNNLNQQGKDNLQLILASESKKVFYNAKETLMMLAAQGIEVNGEYFDITLAHKILNAGLDNNSISLNKMLALYLGAKYSGKVPLNNAAKEGDIKTNVGLLVCLYKRLKKLLKEHSLEKIVQLEFQCIPAIVELEKNGILFDCKKWDQEKKHCKNVNANYKKSINPQTGRIHPKYSQIGTSTGRITCSNPNLQGVPRIRSLRSCFIPAPGNKFIIADYSQIELRIVAELSSDVTMTEAFKNGEDLHWITALKITDKFEEELTEKDRQAAKAVNFGLIYDMSFLKLKEYAHEKYNVDMSEQSALIFRNMFFRTYSGISKWHERLKEQNTKEARTISGRRRLWAGEPKTSELYNAPVQGTASDIMKTALALLNKKLKGTKVKIVGTVHDEIIVEVPEHCADIYRVVILEAMVDAWNQHIKDVPIAIEANICDSWAEK
jgi:DNA polymerase I-like protein with 3'-5' exonuclease and polymerase domains